jgi:hypothetical protein
MASRADRDRAEGAANRIALAGPVDGQDPAHGQRIPGSVPGHARGRDGRPEEQADDLVGTVSNVTNFDPLASAQKEMEAALETPAKDANLSAEPTADAAPAVPTPPVEPAAPLPAIDVPLPDAPAPVSEKDFVPAEAPPPKETQKQAGGSG